MIEKRCVTCRNFFQCNDGEDWKRHCIGCFKEKKRAERQAEERVVHRDRVVYRDRIVQEKIPEEMLDRLIRLCHPDKHENSVASNKAAAWLLDQRKNQ